MSNLREVLITVSSLQTSDRYLAKSYPDKDYDNNGLHELYEVPVYKVFLDGTDADGKPQRREWTALRFMPYWNDPKMPEPGHEADTKGWVNSGIHFHKKQHVLHYNPHYTVRNTTSAFFGSIKVRKHFLIHAGPVSLANIGWGSAGCVEIIGSFDEFRLHLIQMAGSSQTDITAGMLEIVAARKLLVQYDMATPPNIKSALRGEIMPRRS
ncbi:hypothetical protein [Polyangium spumosum]|uniref:Uncharacterized protein n=1 Tax=Polyangium spumosum TaxID=889282 RepID=A0A6N7Q293_9BACT|nr:hypothetical protein [Polyangium spumosum]MRG96384.1 hypothetical protein [Polyangium spumosum]